MRQTYPTTTETLAILDGRVKEVADEMDVDKSAIYQILCGRESDPFGKFKRLYAAVVRTGADVSPWDRAFTAIRARYEKPKPSKSIIECLLDKMNEENDTNTKIIDFIKDGKIDAHEARIIQKFIEKEKSTIELLELHMAHSTELKAVRG